MSAPPPPLPDQGPTGQQPPSAPGHPSGMPGSVPPSGTVPHAPGAPGVPVGMSPEELRQLARGSHPGPGQQRIIDTTAGRTDGINRCPTCGGTDIRYIVEQRGLVCGHCRSVWNEPNAQEMFNLNTEIGELEGVHIASGSQQITEEVSVVTIECAGCGAEVVLSTADSGHQRCHWCRQELSLNRQVPNGAIPDAVLPFLLTRDEAVQRIGEFAQKRRTFAHRRFLAEFEPNNVMGVYIPYMVVDSHLIARLEGRGEITTRTWTETHGTGDNKRTVRYYRADVYQVGRQFTMHVDDLSIVSAGDYSMRNSARSTNNILNAILPYDTPEAVAYNSAYLRGFTSERRDRDVTQLDAEVDERLLAIARAEAAKTIGQYGRGVRWEREGEKIIGSRWVSVYVPVWLYSYSQFARDGSVLVHYIAVNARTGRTMGSVPVSHPRIAALSCLVTTVVTALTVLFLMWVLLT